MFLVQSEFISERLTVAEEETIVKFEEQMEHRHRRPDKTWEAQINSPDLLQQPVSKEAKVLPDQFLCNQERNSSLDQKEPEPPSIEREQKEPEPQWVKEEPEFPQMKEEQEELCIVQVEEQLVLKQETGVMVQFKSECDDTLNMFENKTILYEEEDHQHTLLEPDIKLHITDVPQQRVCKEEEDLFDHQERNSGLEEEMELPQMKEELEELCSSQDKEQLLLEQETETFMVTSTYQRKDLSEAEPNPEQLHFHKSPLAASQSQEQIKHLDSGSTPDVEMNPERRCCRNRTEDKNVDLCSASQSRLETQLNKKSLKCDVCGKAFRYKFHMEQHSRIHTGVKPYECQTCGKGFTQKVHLLNHMRTHLGERTYSCETCGKSFVLNSTLLKHMTIHTGEKRFSCGTCGESFRVSSMLSVHMRTHTGEKPFPCRTCGKSFSQRSNLLCHMRIHTGERPFSCGTCGKDFSHKCSLKRHMTVHVHAAPHHCDVCRKRFRYRNNLCKHMKTHKQSGFLRESWEELPSSP